MTTQHTPGPRAGSSLNWLVVNPDGKLLAILDSESEAHFFTRNRGHANGAVYFKASCDYAAAPELLAACKEMVNEARERNRVVGYTQFNPAALEIAIAAIAKATNE